MSEPRELLKGQLLKILQIQAQVVSDSHDPDAAFKEQMVNHSEMWTKRLQAEQFTLAQLKSLLAETLTYWNESISGDTELFWQMLASHRIPIERKDELRFALHKGRFRRGDIAILARLHWDHLKHLETLKARHSQEEINQLEQIITADENKRVDMLRSCLQKKVVPQSQYIKCGENLAYLGHAKRWQHHFTRNEFEELLQMHRNFQSRPRT